MMQIKPGGPYIGLFRTVDRDTQVLTNADSTPIAVLTRNGADDLAVTLTVTNLSTGRYKITGTIPATYAAGDFISIGVTATVNGISSGDEMPGFQLVTGPLASGTITATTGTTTTLDSGAVADADRYVGSRLVCGNQERVITAYSVGRVATHLAWDSNPSSGAPFEIQQARVTADVSSNVTLSPVISIMVPSGEVISQPITVYQYEAKTFTFYLTDENGDAVNDLGDSFKLTVYKLDGVTVVFEETGTATGAGGNQVPITVTSAHTQSSGTFIYRLWNTTEDAVRAENAFEIRKGAEHT